MRLEDVAPRTLLLGTAAAWAVAAWLLALAGMGSRLPAPDTAAMRAPPLPALPQSTAPALGPASQYAAIAARPLFATDRRPHPFSLQGAGGQPSDAPAFDLVLTSVLITPQARIAIVQKPDGSAAWRVRVGEAPEAYPGWHLSGLAPRSATFVGPEGEKTLQLRVFGGQGGAAPTPSMPTPPTGPVPPPVEMPGPVPGPGAATVPTPAPPPTDASAAPDPQQIEAIRRRIEARREAMRQRAQNANPPTAAPPAPPAR
ncbi:general secretion pathway protein GspN [Lysobacter sp. N42]|jgi:general secretion pathway protein N|uniref:general secretion pathway protein GspN n=1 Tax=Lysobacter sp. N42 TaxID=2545719 RepID=UPI00104D42A2|nr:general secretion pathway protein GspN [Lysobacter sp. N42]TCZ79157.1 general secretion pathway protein GspN [Lysobacter sp. N42]